MAGLRAGVDFAPLGTHFAPEGQSWKCPQVAGSVVFLKSELIDFADFADFAVSGNRACTHARSLRYGCASCALRGCASCTSRPTLSGAAKSAKSAKCPPLLGFMRQSSRAPSAKSAKCDRAATGSMGGRIGRIGRIAGRRGCAQSTTSRDSVAILAACQTLTRDGRAQSTRRMHKPLAVC